MKKRLLVLISVILLFSMATLFFKAQDETTIKYFPFDDTVTFLHSETMLHMEPNREMIQWESTSTTSESVYLRQDIALLYENGKFKRLMRKWEQDADTIMLRDTVRAIENTLLQAISFHHGEIHESSTISSVQKMSWQSCYVMKENDSLKIFDQPKNVHEKRLAAYLNTLTDKHLFDQWQKLIDDLHIDATQYDTYPLVEFVQRGQTVFPEKTSVESEKIIGQLWEGLYKNYILPLDQLDTDTAEHTMPFVMIHKNEPHLFVIFELNGEVQQLIQQFSS